MCSAWRFCLFVYFDLSPRGMIVSPHWASVPKKQRSPKSERASGVPAGPKSCPACSSGGSGRPLPPGRLRRQRLVRPGRQEAAVRGGGGGRRGEVGRPLERADAVAPV